VRHLRTLTILVVLLALGTVPAGAADPPAATAAPSTPAAEKTPASEKAPATEKTPSTETAAAHTAEPAEAKADDPDLDVNKAQPDFALSALPTTLRLPKHKLVFRMTHRFTTPLEDSGFGNLFGMDDGAVIGLELRYGLFPGAQVGFYRTSDRTIEFFTEYTFRKQGSGLPFGLAAFGSIEGTNNFQDKYSPAIGAIVSREFGSRLAVYAQPFWVNNSNPDPAAVVDDNNTTFLGLGARARVLETTYLTFEVAPRLSGYSPGSTHAAIGIEKRAGGHTFQLTFANSPGTTIANIARGGPAGNDWYIGFNLTRKFF